MDGAIFRSNLISKEAYFIGLTTIILTTKLLTVGGVTDHAIINALHPPVETKHRIFKVADNPNDNPKPRAKVKPKRKAQPKAESLDEIYEVTAYTPFCDTGCIGITKTGIDVRNSVIHEGKRIVAVDPNVIPLGSTLELRLSNGKVIEATAQDTGGDIKGRRLDLLFATEDEANEFGRQAVKVLVISQKGQ